MATNETPEQPPEQPNETPQGVQISIGGFNISSKMLIIGGAGGGAALVVVIVVVILLATGMFGGGGGASGGGDWLAYVPSDAAGVGIADNRAISDGDVPEDFADYWEDEDDGASERTYDFVDVDEDDLIVHATVVDDNFDGTLDILQGNFDFDIIREELEDGRDCEDDDYRGFELWECPGQEYPAVALFEKDKYVVLAAQRQSDLEDILTYKSRTPEKLANADDSDIKRLLGQTDGWLQWAILGDACPIDRCQGVAIALGESGDSADMPASYALLFNSERAATAAEGNIEIDDLLEGWFALFALDLGIGEVKAQGEFVVGSGTAEFVDPDEPRSSNRGSGGGSARPAATAAPAMAVPTAAPASATATATPERTAHEAVGREEWVEDCSEITLAQTNQRLARHEQITRGDAYEHCECLHDYVQEWEGPPAATMSDVAAGRLGADALSFANVLSDASSYCAGW